jgi:outer membrane protein assembly factor BamB
VGLRTTEAGEAMNSAICGGLVVCAAGAVALGAGATGSGEASWLQWGGPDRSFRAESKGLSATWPAEGPRKLWSRELGDGYSAILVDGSRLYTMHRVEGREAVICLDAADGKMVWEQRYEAPLAKGHVTEFGEGPRATPLISGGAIYAIGVSGKMHALDKASGKVLWAHDLWGEFGGNALEHGYASSPVEYADTVIALVGGPGQSLVAFDKKDGRVAWKSLDFRNSYSSPRILKVNGKDQLVTFMATEVIGVDPASGALLWSHPHENQWKHNINMPILIDGNRLFLSAPEAGAKGLKLVADGDKTRVEEVWSTRKIQFYHVTTVSEGDWAYGSTGQMAPAFMAAINMRTGEIGWRERGMAKANVVWADGKLLILDEDGKLYLATATPEALTVHAKASLFDEVAWTVPTVVGQRMFVRSKKSIMALDLGQEGAES